ncbi:hypothetical protein B296_00019753 [Ensete ventricosum]|uniref:Uncharacterized protein n=1 Tax=Ensete ventricosum TaxID=4639 RepID=A0A426ZN48_ENSVE|nr:hypothetical protein B296_00019753 [Ensete ventricosum]
MDSLGASVDTHILIEPLLDATTVGFDHSESMTATWSSERSRSVTQHTSEASWLQTGRSRIGSSASSEMTLMF